jgi:hypothetical protein
MSRIVALMVFAATHQHGENGMQSCCLLALATSLFKAEYADNPPVVLLITC